MDAGDAEREAEVWQLTITGSREPPTRPFLLTRCPAFAAQRTFSMRVHAVHIRATTFSTISRTMRQSEDSDLNSSERESEAGGEPTGSDPRTDSDGPGAETTSADATGGSDVEATDVNKKLADQQEKYLRLAAEYDNYRKRTTRERAESYTRAQGDLVKQLLDGLDDLARFAHIDPDTVDSKTIGQGVEMVEKKLYKALSTAGLEVLDPTNQSFDPTLHEAVSTEPALSPEDDHVVSRVFQAGYLFKGQLLRPARVVVKQWNG
jgi:molecular chaperone GrpE